MDAKLNIRSDLFRFKIQRISWGYARVEVVAKSLCLTPSITYCPVGPLCCCKRKEKLAKITALKRQRRTMWKQFGFETIDVKIKGKVEAVF